VLFTTQSSLGGQVQRCKLKPVIFRVSRYKINRRVSRLREPPSYRHFSVYRIRLCRARTSVLCYIQYSTVKSVPVCVLYCDSDRAASLKVLFSNPRYYGITALSVVSSTCIYIYKINRRVPCPTSTNSVSRVSVCVAHICTVLYYTVPVTALQI
jgi:hypothetical protein